MNISKKLSSRFSKFLPVLLLTIICCLFFWKFFLKAEIPIPGDFVVGVYPPWLDYKWGYPAGVPVKNPITADVVSFIYPMQMMGVTALKSGIIALWNPYILTGTPLLANFQSAVFSPSNIVYFLFEKNTAWTIQIILQHILAAVFTYILLRWWKLGKLPAIIGGVIYAFGGFNLIWSQWNGHTLTAAWLPLIVLCVDAFIKSRKTIYIIALAVTFGLQIFSGYPQLVFYSLPIIAIIWLIRFREMEKRLSITSSLLVAVILGVLLAAVQILPGSELLGQSQRKIEPHPFEWAFLPYQKVITFIAPDYFGNHATQNYWGPQDYTSNTGFVGVVALSLALIGFSGLRKKPEIMICVLIAITGLVLSFPTIVSLTLWKSGLFGFQAAAAHRALVLWNLGVALLAAFAFQQKSKKLIFLPLILFVIFATHAVFLQNLIAIKNLIFPMVVYIGFLVAFFLKWRVVILLLVIMELFRFGWKFTPFSPRSLIFPKTPIHEFLLSQKQPFRVTGSSVIPINFQMAYGLETPEGYDAVYPERISNFLHTLNSGTPKEGEVRRYAHVDFVSSRLLDLINTKYIITKTPDIFDTTRYKQAFQDKSVTIMESKTVLPRAFMVYDWEVESDGSKILQKILDPGFSFASKIILEEQQQVSLPSEKGIAEVRYKNYHEQGSSLDVNTSNDGFLFISDAFAPGWKAYVDGIQTKIYRANYAFRAIPITSGSHTVTLNYHPDSFSLGLKLSLISFVALLMILSYTIFKRT